MAPDTLATIAEYYPPRSPRAVQIAREAGLDEEVCFQFDVLEDELSLARTGVYGTVQQRRDDALRVLAAFPTLDEPPCSPWKNG